MVIVERLLTTVNGGDASCAQARANSGGQRTDPARAADWAEVAREFLMANYGTIKRTGCLHKPISRGCSRGCMAKNQEAVTRPKPGMPMQAIRWCGNHLSRILFCRPILYYPV